MRERGNEKRRTKLRLLLTPTERGKLDAAVLETGTTRSLLILEAIQAGLADPNLKTTQEKRNRRTDAWVPSPTKKKLRQLAATLNVTQQHLTRHILRAYLASAPWNPRPPQPQTEPRTNGGVDVAV
jgi:hypothetical protein